MSTFRPMLLCAAALFLCAGVGLAQNSSSGAGGGGGEEGGAGGDGQVIEAPKVSPEQLKALEAALTPQQKRLLEESCTAHVEAEMGADFEALQSRAAKMGLKINTREDLVKVYRESSMKFLCVMSPDQRKQYFEQLPAQIMEARLRNDPAYVTGEEKAAAAKVPPEARKDVELLASDDLDTFMAARKRTIAHGPAVLPLVAEKFRALPEDSILRVRFQSVLLELRSYAEVERERLIRTSEEAFQHLGAQKKAHAGAQLACLISRRLTSVSGRNGTPMYDDLCYYSFPRKTNGYKGAVSLMFDNGGDLNRFDVIMYGGQASVLADLGAVDFADVNAGAAKTAAFTDCRSGTDIVAANGHVYLERHRESRDGIDALYKFRVVEIESGKWVIIEWAELSAKK